MIGTKEQMKTLLNIGSSYDALIAANLPLIEEEIHEYTKNHFINYDEDIYVRNTTISFDKDNSQILDSNNGFTEFKTGMTIKVFGSKYNNGIYYVSSVNDGYLTIDTTYQNIEFDEASSNSIAVYKVTYPKSLVLVLSQMINYNLKPRDKFYQNEKIDDYSITYINKNFQYPISVVKALNKYCKVYKKDMLNVSEEALIYGG